MADKEYIEREAALKAFDGIPAWGDTAKMLVDCVPAADVAPRSVVAREIFGALLEHAYKDSYGHFCVPMAIIEAMMANAR